MSEDNNNKEPIKIIDINSENFFTEAEPHFEKHARQTGSDSFLVKLIIVSVLLSFILIGLVVFVPLEKLNETSLGKAMKQNSIQTEMKGDFNLFKKRENILLLGVDSNNDEYADKFEKTRTDSIMLVSIDNSSKSVNVISIPRDSKVYIDGHGIDKINAAHATGGIEATIKTVQNMFGIRVDHYVLVDYNGMKEIIKILGTVPVNVEKKLRYTDYSGKLFVKLDPGMQELDAEQAEQFARFRHDAVGDIGRVERQRMLVKGIITKIKSPESIAKLPEIISTTNNYIKTDMTIFDLSRYAGIAKSINLDDVVVATLPGHPSQNSYISYWILEPERVQSIIDRLVYRIEKDDPKAAPLKISLLYNPEYVKDIETLKTQLQEYGMDVICDTETTKLTSEIIAHSDNVTSKKYKYLKTIIPQLKKAHMTISYENYYCGDADVTLVLGK